ncbi:glycerophosphodiester phosphodiesterase family protein [Streptomyces sp. PU10]|uniref:glycerophosphodiester phosphodiesterase n=2 Tax=Streptomyces TaxID=1883 RepID=UPI00106E68C6|nr:MULTISPECIES: glycerophosphodiester phosphodiesterase family protein [unclassified Streptomyces]MDU0252071.1 glycerophosphodiester phosphodiesterase family protein [Streptomyces sp. PU10]QKW65168.1 hydrolase [Streptomyces sp. NA03103]
MKFPSKRRAGAVVAVLSGLALAVTSTPAQAATDGPDVIAHRGSSGMAPENTAAAIDLAVRQRADHVEIDVQRTKDGTLVNFHDCTMERTTNVEDLYPGRPSYRVSDFTWNELRQLDAGSWFHDKYAGERIITVDTVIRHLQHTRTGLLAEISPCSQYGTTIATDLADTLRGKPGYVRKALARKQLAVQSFETDDARTFHTAQPDIPIGILDADRPTDTELVELSQWADQINPQHTVTDQTLVDRIHQLGMTTNVWTVDEPGTIRKMLNLGVDGIITDYPQTLTRR